MENSLFSTFFLPMLKWYFISLLLQLSFLPLTLKIFRKHFWDKGYSLSRTIGIIILSYSIFALSFLKIIPFKTSFLYLLWIFIFLLQIKILKQDLKKAVKEIKKALLDPIWLKYELVFLCSFFIWGFIRGQNPEIQSLEKFMDFGFINSILRTKFFPPKDIWLIAPKGEEPFYINYYYFGHLITAVWIKLTQIPSIIGYNVMLAYLFASGITIGITLVSNNLLAFVKTIKKNLSQKWLFLYGIFGTLILNLGGNLQTIYIFTKGYEVGTPNPPPFWDKTVRYSLRELISLLKQTNYNPISFLDQIISQSQYWYANATRFIPYTIHEFPSYSYIVADLHGHLLNIPNNMLILCFLTLFFLFIVKTKLSVKKFYTFAFLFGFLASISYMTNAVDGPIYIGITGLMSFILLRKRFMQRIIFFLLIILSFSLSSFFFNSNFIPFVQSIGVNCPPQFLSEDKKFLIFTLIKSNCQRTPLWMFLTIWGYIVFTVIIVQIFLLKFNLLKNKVGKFLSILNLSILGLILFAEFFYFKDIYPAHFRANTLFKLGYQAYIMSSITATLSLYLIKNHIKNIAIKTLFYSASLLVISYFTFAIPSMYGRLNKQPSLDGSSWLKIRYPEDWEVIQFFNNHVSDQPYILEAQGDSYTEYERISAYTGLPTIAGWYVHEWLWRRTNEFVAKRIPYIETVYKTSDPNLAKQILDKFEVKYVIISTLEYQRYPGLNEEKFYQIGRLVFQSKNRKAKVFEIY